MSSAERRRPGRRAALIALVVTAGASGTSGAQSTAPSSAAWQAVPVSIAPFVETNTFGYAMRGTWWNLAAGVDPSYDDRRRFVELWVHPGVRATWPVSAAVELRAGVSAGATKTLGADAFDYREENAVRVENAFVGARFGETGGLRFDLSAGRQPLVLGTGMLIAAGASNGYDRGGGASAKRVAWEETVIARVESGAWSAQAFHLEPDEAAAAGTHTRLAGVAVEWADEKRGRAGLAWLRVPRSDAVYPGQLAPLAFIEKGRDGLSTWHAWARFDAPFASLPELGLRAELAQQRNDIRRVDGRSDPMRAIAWMAGASWWFRTLPFAPKVAWHHARFSGDDPATSRYERFDPLYWGNGLENWWFGANGSYAFINSNVRFDRLIVDAYASERDVLQLQFVRARADRLDSPIQFGQGMRFVPTASGSALVVGVPTAHLADEIYLQYARVFTPKIVASAFVARSAPGAGIRAIAPAGASAWVTVGAGLLANFD